MPTWTWCISLITAACWCGLTSASPSGRMIGISVWVFLTLKLESWRQMIVRETSKTRTWGDLFLWLLATPTLNAAAFFRARCQQKAPQCREWSRAVGCLLAGVILFAGLAPLCEDLSRMAAGWVVLAGLILGLHFGLLNLIALSWQMSGRDVDELMLAPESSTSLSEFWGKRWNTAFRDFSHQTMFRPLTRRFGPSLAIFVVFVFSGIIHELAISFPVRAGYGGPFGYFLLQWLGLVIERRGFQRGWPLRSGLMGRVYTASWVLIPAGLLFHSPFVTHALVPLLP